MKMYPAPRIQCALLVLMVLLNPIMASAGALFSVNTAGSEQTEQVANCHEQQTTNPGQLNESQDKDNAGDCCNSPCECDDSGCHSVSVLIDNQKPHFLTFSSASDFQSNNYHSLVTDPGSPPPIV